MDELRRQVLTVNGWGEGSDRMDWTPSWQRPEGTPDYMSNDIFTGVIQGVFTDGIGRTAWSPDGSKLALDLRLGPLLPLPPPQEPAEEPAMTPTLLAVTVVLGAALVSILQFVYFLGLSRRD